MNTTGSSDPLAGVWGAFHTTQSWLGRTLFGLGGGQVKLAGVGLGTSLVGSLDLHEDTCKGKPKREDNSPNTERTHN